MYFLRLTKIKPAVEEVAAASWEGTTIGGEEAKRVDRVLDVRQGELCWVVGTVYMSMALKPNILEDVSKDVRLFHRLRRLWREEANGLSEMDIGAYNASEVL